MAAAAAAMALIVAGGLLSGCGAVRPISYFQLRARPESSPTGTAVPLPVTLLVGSLLASHVYSEDRIVYSDGGGQMGTYEYQRWANPPTEMIEELLLRRLRASGRYQAVYYQRTSTAGDFAIRGRLYDFCELTGTPFAARVSFEIELRDLKTGATVWTHDYTHDEPVAGKDVRAVVAALDRSVQRGIDEVAAGLERYFTAGK